MTSIGGLGGGGGAGGGRRTVGATAVTTRFADFAFFAGRVGASAKDGVTMALCVGTAAPSGA